MFCKIISGELPASKVYEDDAVLAFLDIAPINKGHTLLVPKEHHVNLLDCPEPLLICLTLALQKVGRAVREGVQADAFNVGLNNGRAAGQLVDHTHFHIIPRFHDDGLQSWGQRHYSDGEAERVVAAIRSALVV